MQARSCRRAIAEAISTASLVAGAMPMAAGADLSVGPDPTPSVRT